MAVVAQLSEADECDALCFQEAAPLALTAAARADWSAEVPAGLLRHLIHVDALGDARPVLYMGAVWALFLAWWCNIERIDERERSIAGTFTWYVNSNVGSDSNINSTR